MPVESFSARAVQVVKANEVRLHIGDEAWRLLANESFWDGWDDLYETCSWATVFQCRAFVTTWYNTFRFKLSPIIITAEYDGRLTGLFTLAMHESNGKNKRIVGAGNFEAEYCVWLTESRHDTTFITEALKKLLHRFPHSIMQFRFVPSQAPLQWMRERYWKGRCVADPHRRPLMDMSDPGLSKLFNKPEFRRKINRIKKLGNVEIERVTSKAAFQALLDELTLMFDFRQGAKFNLNQFRGEPLRAAMFIELFEQNLLHVTVLKANGKLLAALVAMASKNWVHMQGINAHTPFDANFYSPGLVHFILAGQLLANEGIAVFDLTPGGDLYKERFATRHDEVYEVVVSNSFIYRLKRKLRRRYFERLQRSGKWPLGTMVAMKKKMYLFKARLRKIKKQGPVAAFAEKMKEWLQPTQEKVYVAFANPMVSMGETPIHKNSIRDMLGFESKGTWVTRWEFLEEAMHQYESGKRSYSFSEEDCLLGCIWADVSSSNNKQLPDNPISNGSITLWGLYCHPKGNGRFESFLKSVVQDLVQEQKTDRVYIRLHDSRFCRVLEACGFKEIGKEEAVNVK